MLSLVHHNLCYMLRPADIWTASLFIQGEEHDTRDDQIDLSLKSAAFASEKEACRVQVKIRRE